MNDKQKIKAFLKSENISDKEFSESLKFSLMFLRRGESLKVNNLRKIIKKYPKLSVKWVVLNEGSMINSENK